MRPGFFIAGLGDQIFLGYVLWWEGEIMSAPNKVGLDYFSFDCDLLRDRKLRKPKMKFGYLAVVVYIALLSTIQSPPLPSESRYPSPLSISKR